MRSEDSAPPEITQAPRRSLWIRIAVLLCAFSIVGVTTDLTGVASRIGMISPGSVLSVFLLIIVLFLMTSLRLTRLLVHAGHPVPFRTGVRANASGLIASLLVVNFVGATIGRQYYLRRHGTDTALTALVVSAERAILAAVSGLLAVSGAFYVFGGSVVAGFFADEPLLFMLITACVVLVVNAMIFNTSTDRRLRKQLTSHNSRRGMSEAAALTVISSLFNLCTYCILILSLGYDTRLPDVFAAAAVVAFAASLPVTINGWGVRELTSVFVFGLIGVSQTDAIAVSVTVGILNLVFVLMLSPVVLSSVAPKQNPAPVQTPAEKHPGAGGFMSPLVLSFGLLTSTLIFFQLPLRAGDTIVTVNLADPVALLAAGLAAAQMLIARSLPFKLSRPVKLWLVGMSLIMVVSLSVGWVRHGVTGWAFGNRGTGWIILIGYFCVGALMSASFGKQGLRRLVAYLLTGAAIIFVATAGHIFLYAAWLTDVEPPLNFEGFSGNRNAYAFQMLALVAVAGPLILGSAGRIRMWQISMIGTAVAACLMSGSLTALLACIVFLIACLAFTLGTVRLAWLAATGLALTIWLMVPLAFDGMVELLDVYGPGARRRAFAETAGLSEGSMKERLQSWILGLQMWQANPVFGAGIGAFILSTTAAGNPLVIHSTYIWILAETGLAGLVVVFALPVVCFRRYLSRFLSHPPAALRGLRKHEAALVLLVLVFGIFSVTHEIAYQRLLWLLLGALLARPGGQHDSLGPLSAGMPAPALNRGIQNWPEKHLQSLDDQNPEPKTKWHADRPDEP